MSSKVPPALLAAGFFIACGGGSGKVIDGGAVDATPRQEVHPSVSTTLDCCDVFLVGTAAIGSSLVIVARPNLLRVSVDGTTEAMVSSATALDTDVEAYLGVFETTASDLHLLRSDWPAPGEMQPVHLDPSLVVATTPSFQASPSNLAVHVETGVERYFIQENFVDDTHPTGRYTFRMVESIGGATPTSTLIDLDPPFVISPVSATTDDGHVLLCTHRDALTMLRLDPTTLVSSRLALEKPPAGIGSVCDILRVADGFVVLWIESEGTGGIVFKAARVSLDGTKLVVPATTVATVPGNADFGQHAVFAGRVVIAESLARAGASAPVDEFHLYSFDASTLVPAEEVVIPSIVDEFPPQYYGQGMDLTALGGHLFITAAISGDGPAHLDLMRLEKWW